MSHFLLTQAVALLPFGMAPRTLRSLLISSRGQPQGFTAPNLRALFGTIDLTPIAPAADYYLLPTPCAEKLPMSLRNRRHWSQLLIGQTLQSGSYLYCVLRITVLIAVGLPRLASFGAPPLFIHYPTKVTRFTFGPADYTYLIGKMGGEVLRNYCSGRGRRDPFDGYYYMTVPLISVYAQFLVSANKSGIFMKHSNNTCNLCPTTCKAFH